MRIFSKIIIGLIALLVILAIAGFFMPKQYSVERSLLIKNVTPEQVFSAINDLKQWKHWGVWYQRDPAMQTTYTGPESGENAKVSWISESEGNGEMLILSSIPNQEVKYRLYFPDFDLGSTGTLRLQQKDQGVLVTWIDEGDLGYNPIYRYFGLFLDDMIGPDFEQGLKNLADFTSKM